MKKDGGKEWFIERLNHLKKTEPFPEGNNYTVQERAFIRGIQISRRKNLKEACKMFDTLLDDEISGISDDIQRAYERGEQGITIDTPPDLPGGGTIDKIKPEGEIEATPVPRKPKPRKPKDKRGRGRSIWEQPKKPETGAPKGRKYKYAGVVLQAKQEDKDRFQRIKESGSRQRYIDTKTGEDISRRERDKRLAGLIAKGNNERIV